MRRRTAAGSDGTATLPVGQGAMTSEPPHARPGVTVGMVTKDSRSRFGDGFAEVLASVKREVPYSRFILADDSTDDTASFAASLCGAEVVPGGGNRAIARQEVIDRAETEWLLFVDDDCVLSSGWYSKMHQQMSSPEVGLIWGAQLARLQDTGAKVDTTERSIRSFQVLGGTHDTLIRMKAIEGMRIPDFLHWREDTYIKRFVEGRGYRVVATSEAGFHHIKSRTKILGSNLQEDPRLRYLCERFVGVYAVDYLKGLRTVAGIVPDLLSLGTVSRETIVRGRLAWFRYYSGLYRYSAQALEKRGRNGVSKTG